MQLMEFSPDLCSSSNSSVENNPIPQISCDEKVPDIHYGNIDTTGEPTKLIAATTTDDTDNCLIRSSTDDLSNDNLWEDIKSELEQHKEEIKPRLLPDVSCNTNIEEMFDQIWISEPIPSMDLSEIYVPLDPPQPTEHTVPDDVYEPVKTI